MKQKELTINERVVTVSKLPLRKYADLFGAFEELPKHLHLINGKTNEEILQNLPILIKNCYPDIVRILTIATDMEEYEVDEMGLDDVILVVTAIMEVNEYQRVYDNIKKLAARPTVPVNQEN